MAAVFNELQERLLNDFQQSIPLSPTPYADMAEALGVEEELLITALQGLIDQGAISRVGPVFRPNRIGVSTLVAMAIPAEAFEAVAELVSARPEVNHNYEREHHFNLWFVVTAIDAEHLDAVLEEIEVQSEYSIMNLPMLEDYFIDLGFDLKWT